MKKLILIVVGIIGIIGINYIGYKVISDNSDIKMEEIEPGYGTTFYARIKEIDENLLLVKGLETNDINFRGDYYLKIDDNVNIMNKDIIINLYELKVKDIISITFVGVMEDSYPGKINGVKEIHLIKYK